MRWNESAKILLGIVGQTNRLSIKDKEMPTKRPLPIIPIPDLLKQNIRRLENDEPMLDKEYLLAAFRAILDGDSADLWFRVPPTPKKRDVYRYELAYILVQALTEKGLTKPWDRVADFLDVDVDTVKDYYKITRRNHPALKK
jgi:hypothetical protein